MIIMVELLAEYTHKCIVGFINFYYLCNYYE